MRLTLYGNTLQQALRRYSFRVVSWLLFSFMIVPYFVVNRLSAGAYHAVVHSFSLISGLTGGYTPGFWGRCGCVIDMSMAC